MCHGYYFQLAAWDWVQMWPKHSSHDFIPWACLQLLISTLIYIRDPTCRLLFPHLDSFSEHRTEGRKEQQHKIHSTSLAQTQICITKSFVPLMKRELYEAHTVLTIPALTFKTYVSVWINDFGDVGILWVSALLSGSGRLWDTAMLEQSKERARLHSYETVNILHSNTIFLQY